MASIDVLYDLVNAINGTTSRINAALGNIYAWLLEDSERLNGVLLRGFVGLEKGILAAIKQTIDSAQSTTTAVNAYTLAQTDRVIGRVDQSTSTIVGQINQASRITNDKLDGVTNLITKLPDQISAAVDKVGDQIVAKINASIGGINDTIEKGLKEVVLHIDMLSLQMDNNTTKIVNASNQGADRVVLAIDEVKDFLVSSARANHAELMTLLATHFQQVHADTVNQTQRLGSAIEGITGALNTAIGAAVVGIGAAIATSTAAEVAAETPQTIALASIAASLGAIVGGFSLFWGANFTGLLEDPKKWLASLITEISEMYYELGKDTFDATADKIDLEE